MLAKGKLAIGPIAETRIVQRLAAIHKENQAVVKTFQSIGIVLSLVIFWIDHLRGPVAFAQVDRIVAVHRLVYRWIAPEMLHDVNLSAMRPIQSLTGLRQHPDGRPKALCHVELGTHLQPPKAKGFLMFAPNAARQKRGFIVGHEVIHHASQHQGSIVEGIERVGRRHVDSPFRPTPPYLRPYLGI